MKFGVKKDSKVLDPCGGWGGRMLGLSVICNNYTACEPCLRTYKGLTKIEKFIQLFNPSFKATLFNEAYEDVDVKENDFDFAITSPPYFDVELYEKWDKGITEGKGVEWRYSTFEDYVDNFFIPLITKTMSALKEGKVFALVLGNRQYKLDQVLSSLSSNCKIALLGKMSDRGNLKRREVGERIFIISKK